MFDTPKRPVAPGSAWTRSTTSNRLSTLAGTGDADEVWPAGRMSLKGTQTARGVASR